MGALNQKKKARLKRKARIRKRIFGTESRPRMSIFRSSKHIYAQIIDDVAGTTLVSASTIEKELRERSDAKGKVGQAVSVGKLIADRAMNKGIKRIVFDRNGFLYHGRVKAVSDGAREAGLEF